LDAAGQRTELGAMIAALRAAGIRVSLFIAAVPKQIEAAVELGAPVIEIHTGAWCHALIDGDKIAAEAEWQRIRRRETGAWPRP
jgi:pyridoxine 5-phosphate synthase